VNPGSVAGRYERWQRSGRPPSPQLVEHIRCAAGDYFPDLRGGLADARLLDAIRTTNADLYRFELRRGERAHQVVAKSRRIRSRQADAGPSSPMPSVPDERKVALEMRALAAIHAHFDALGRPELGAIRPLEEVVPDRVFVMEAAPGEILQRSLMRLARSAEPPGVLLASVRHSGAWLREFHQLADLEHTEPQLVSRDEFLAWLGRLVGFCKERDAGRFAGLSPRLEAAALRALPAQLPRGLGHGDFHAANVIADASGRVRIIDTFAAWSGPVYYDLSQYLYDLKSPARRMYDQGLRAQPAHVAAAEREFLRGYYGDGPVPLAAIRLFEIQWLLFRFARSARAAQRPGAVGGAKRVRLRLKSRFTDLLLAGLLRDLEAAGSNPLDV
jgi:aminoglycoside phosphotransferase (APT) family kinase protein